MEKIIITPEEPKEPQSSDELSSDEMYFEPSTDSEYIASALNALMAVSDIDTAIISKVDERRIKRIKRQSLRIISYCLNNQYEELFEDNNDDSNED